MSADLPDVLPEITDDQMRAGLATTKEYTVVLLTAGPAYAGEEAPAVVWEHGRRNFALREAGLLSVVCPVMDDSPLCGVAVFDLDVERTTRLMEDDPGVRAGVFTYAVHPVRGFPGDALAG